MSTNEVNILTQQIQGQSPQEALAHIANTYGTDATFSTSFGIEDQAVTFMIANTSLPIHIFTLDTGRMFQETYSTWSRTVDKYKLSIETYYPDVVALEKFTTQHGPNAFYESVELRKQCCHLRKVVPLQRALKDKKIWITGIRAAQSNNRTEMPQVEWDATNNIIKFHPILNWSNEELKEYIKVNSIPYNPLHDKGFVSIGCAPCTRAIREGEDFRAGRWWWEDTSKKECGLHVHDK
jgi:phosphoadenosine phosphosulfate reductase